MTPSRKERQGRLASRAVQATFLIVLIVLWYLATTRWRASPLLLPNPVTVLFVAVLLVAALGSAVARISGAGNGRRGAH